MSGELMHGGDVEVDPSVLYDGCIYVVTRNPFAEWTGVHLTKIEAIGLAQQLLKAANAETVTP